MYGPGSPPKALNDREVSSTNTGPDICLCSEKSSYVGRHLRYLRLFDIYICIYRGDYPGSQLSPVSILIQQRHHPRWLELL